MHVGGSFNTARAAWPHFVEQGYGRIVKTTSSGMFGLPEQPRVRHRQGRGRRTDAQPRHRRRRRTASSCNLVAPAAFTRMAGAADDDSPMATTMAPELVAPMVAYLAHEDCPVSGEIYAAGAGRFARIFLAQAEGYVDADRRAHGRGRRRALGGRSTTSRATPSPADLMDWSAAFMAHLS